jgi:hypothetical protein
VNSIVTAERTQTLAGRYITSVHHIECRLELRLDQMGCLSGVFVADGEHLRILGGAPDAYGEVFGLILEPSGHILAVFRAVPEAEHLILEVDVPGEGDLMHLGNVERLRFRRLALDESPIASKVWKMRGPSPECP